MSVILLVWVSLLMVEIVSSDGIFTQPLKTYRDESYGLNVDVGTPSQSTLLRLELFESSLLAMSNARSQVMLAGVSCERCCLKSLYDPTNSTTSQCGKSTKRVGFLQLAKCQDTLSVLGATYKEFPFYEVTAAGFGTSFIDNAWDGAFVLMRRPLSSVHGLDVVGLYMKRTCSKGFADDAGTITAGGMDSKNCGKAGPAFELRSSPNDPPSIHVSAAQIDTTALPGGPWRAQFFLTEAWIFAPKTVFAALIRRWGLKQQADGWKWMIACDSTGSLQVTFKNDEGQSQTLTVDVSQVIYNDGNKCVLQMTGLYDDRYWIFGTSLFRSYCALFDFSKTDSPDTIAFAEKTTSDSGPCVYDPPTAVPTCDVDATTAFITETSSLERTTKLARRSSNTSVFTVMLLVFICSLKL